MKKTTFDTDIIVRAISAEIISYLKKKPEEENQKSLSYFLSKTIQRILIFTVDKEFTRTILTNKFKELGHFIRGWKRTKQMERLADEGGSIPELIVMSEKNNVDLYDVIIKVKKQFQMNYANLKNKTIKGKLNDLKNIEKNSSKFKSDIRDFKGSEYDMQHIVTTKEEQNEWKQEIAFICYDNHFFSKEKEIENFGVKILRPSSVK